MAVPLAPLICVVLRVPAVPPVPMLQRAGRSNGGGEFDAGGVERAAGEIDGAFAVGADDEAEGIRPRATADGGRAGGVGVRGEHADPVGDRPVSLISSVPVPDSPMPSAVELTHEPLLTLSVPSPVSVDPKMVPSLVTMPLPVTSTVPLPKAPMTTKFVLVQVPLEIRATPVELSSKPMKELPTVSAAGPLISRVALVAALLATVGFCRWDW